MPFVLRNLNRVTDYEEQSEGKITAVHCGNESNTSELSGAKDAPICEEPEQLHGRLEKAGHGREEHEMILNNGDRGPEVHSIGAGLTGKAQVNHFTKPRRNSGENFVTLAGQRAADMIKSLSSIGKFGGRKQEDVERFFLRIEGWHGLRKL